MSEQEQATLLLEDGSVFQGKSFGFKGEKTAEIVFNTSLTGYEEIMTDPSYRGQMLTMTYPHIGNYGINYEDAESSRIWIEALIVRECSKEYSNFSAKISLHDYLVKNEIPGIEEIDTRSLVRILREKGSMTAIISAIDHDISSLQRKLSGLVPMSKRNLVEEVNSSGYSLYSTYKSSMKAMDNEEAIALIDYGAKLNIIKQLEKRAMKIRIFSAQTDLKKILEYKTSGIVLSNGPGDPETVASGIDLASELLEYNKENYLPVLGICLGHQLISLGSGAHTYKLKFGHHGGNHPVKNLKTGRVEITVQNHNYCLDSTTLSENFEISHMNLNDNTVEGMNHKLFPIMSLQYHPEAGPGPHDSEYIFDEFLKLIKHAKT